MKNNLNINKIILNVLANLSEELKEYTINQGLQIVYMNSYPTAFWDFLNRDIKKAFKPYDNIKICNIKRGPWNFIIIFNLITGIMYTFMRENRFKELSRSNNIQHYAKALASVFNQDIYNPQLSIDGITYSITSSAESTAENICNTLNITKKMVNSYAIILFSADTDMLKSARICWVDSNFEACKEENLSNSIKVLSADVVMDKINTEELQEKYKSNNRLKLTSKATSRIQNNNIKDSISLQKNENRKIN